MATIVMDQRPAAGGKAPRFRKARGTTSPATGVAPSKRSVSGRNRVSFTSDQLDDMEHVFQMTQYPDVTILEALAIRLQLPIEKICTWFQNRRSKFRKESKKGHITWMREQLLSGGQKEPNPEEATSAAKKSPQSNAHVLSKVNTQLSPDDKIPRTRVHHLPTPQIPVTTFNPTPSYPRQVASYPGAQQSQPHITSTQVQQQISPLPHQSPVMLNSGAYMGGQSHWASSYNSVPYTINNTAPYTASWNTMYPASTTYTGWYGQTGHIPNYHMGPYVNSSRMHPYHIQDNNSQYTCTSPQISSNNHSESGNTTINSPPSCATSQFSALNSSPASSHSTSSLNGSKNTSVSPVAANNSNLSCSSTGASLSPVCEQNPQAHSETQVNSSHVKTTYHTVASFTPVTMPSAEYPIPPLTPFSLSQCYDTLDDYTPAVYGVL